MSDHSSGVIYVVWTVKTAKEELVSYELTLYF